MSNKKKVWVMGNGLFNLYGYKNLRLPALIDLAQTEIDACKVKGYLIKEFNGKNCKTGNDGVRSISAYSLLKKKNS